MTRNAKIQQFFEGFGIDAFISTNKPEPLTYPCIVWENVEAYWGDQASMTVHLWYYTDSEAIPNAMAKKIADTIGAGGIILKHDSGEVWLRRGTPWCNSMSDDSDQTIKHKIINIDLEDWRF